MVDSKHLRTHLGAALLRTEQLEAAMQQFERVAQLSGNVTTAQLQQQPPPAWSAIAPSLVAQYHLAEALRQAGQLTESAALLSTLTTAVQVIATMSSMQHCPQ